MALRWFPRMFPTRPKKERTMSLDGRSLWRRFFLHPLPRWRVVPTTSVSSQWKLLRLRMFSDVSCTSANPTETKSRGFVLFLPLPFLPRKTNIKGTNTTIFGRPPLFRDIPKHRQTYPCRSTQHVIPQARFGGYPIAGVCG